MAEQRVCDGDIVKCSWREEDFYAFVVSAGERDLAIMRIDEGRPYRQIPLAAVVVHWKLAQAHSTEPLGAMLEFQKGAVKPDDGEGEQKRCTCWRIPVNHEGARVVDDPLCPIHGGYCSCDPNQVGCPDPDCPVHERGE